MRSPRDGRIAVTFNGEIYGYRDLRKSLPDYPFRTKSDTEVILALYEIHGLDFVRRLPGMFAFALWDARHQRLVCARDRFGEKPLYYTLRADGELLFASELKALRAGGLGEPDVDPLSLAHYLRRLYVPADRTIYEDVHSLPPGHALVFEDGRLDLSCYWQLPPPSSPRNRARRSRRGVRARFETAVTSQLVADVPVAAFLSGGADSTSIVAAVAKHAPGLTTLAFGFGAGPDELPYAAEVARQYGAAT